MSRIGKDGDMGTDEARVSVLIVDDQASNLLALEAILGDSGLNLVRARSGRDALIRVLDDDFAVILMDVQMPDMDGFEAAELIRGRDRSKHTPIIFLTAFQSNDEQVERGYALGAVDFLAKPIVPTVLRSKVSVFVELFQKTEQVRRQADQLFENQRHEHRRELVEERRRWEVERLREEAAREKKAAEELSRRADELTLSIAERVRAEEQLRALAAQQAAVAELGRRALAGADLSALLGEAVAAAARHLGVEFGLVMELDPGGGTLAARAGVGWWEGSTAGAIEVMVESSLAGFTLRTGSAVVVEDLRDERRFAAAPLLRDHGVIGGISVVIEGRERPFGTLGVFSDRPRAYAQDDVHYLQSVANVLAAAIQRRRDDEELAAVRDELAAQLADMTRLHALGARLSNSLELPSVLEEVLAAVTGLQGTDRGVLMLFDRERGAMRTAAAVGFSADQLDAVEQATPGLPPNGSVTAVISGSIIVEDVASDPVFAPHLSAALRAGCHAVCSTPLLTCGSELIGSIATYFPRPHRPSDRETRLVELYARQAAEFIDNARLYREIREADRQKGVFLAMLAQRAAQPAGADPQRPARPPHARRRPRVGRAGARHRRAAGAAPGPPGRRPARRLPDQHQQGRAAARPDRPARRRGPRRRDRAAADRGARPRAVGGRRRRAVAPDGRRGPARAGPVEPPEQRRQVHRARRPDRAGGCPRGGRRGRPRARHRHRHRPRSAAARL